MRGLRWSGRARLLLLAGLATALVAVGSLAAWDVTGSDGPAAAGALPSRSAKAGPVEVTVTPTRVDSTGATFEVVLDNHEVDLTMDLAGGATLTVGSTAWGAASWSGDGPGGHHRKGTLSFPASGLRGDRLVLTLSGLPEPVELQWAMPEGAADS